MSVTELWRASLNPSSPRYIEWRKIFASDDIPIVSPFPIKAKLGEETDMIYAICWDELDGPTADRLVDYMAEKFNASPITVAEQIESDSHFPIRASDVIIAFSPRAFM